MAINFEPIFSEMQSGPEKIKENFDKVNNGLLWGQSQQFLNLDGLNSNYTSYKIRNNGSEMHIGMYITGDGSGSCYLPISIAKKWEILKLLGVQIIMALASCILMLILVNAHSINLTAQGCIFKH